MDDSSQTSAPTLESGASFGDIAAASAHQEAISATPDATQPGASEAPATEGGEPTAEGGELPGVLQDTKPDDDGDSDADGDTPDLSSDPDLEKHPVLKAKMEAYIARKEKGIQKFMERETAKTAELSQFREDWTPLVNEYQRYNQGPEEALKAYQELGQRLEQFYESDFTGARQVTKTSQEPVTDEDAERVAYERYQTETPLQMERRLKAEARNEILGDMKALLDERLGPVIQKIEPIAQRFETDQQVAARTDAAAKALPALQAEFQTASKPWITQEMVQEALAKYPTLDARSAFSAIYVREIARYMAEHSQGRSAAPRDLPRGESGASMAPPLEFGASFGDIAASMGHIG